MCEYPEFINQTNPVARKSHWCGECNALIPAGEVYQRISGKWAGEVSVYAQCMPCSRAWEWLNNEVDCLSYSGLWEGIMENDMEDQIPRSLLSHQMLMWLHQREIEHAENNNDGADILPIPDQTLVGLYRVHAENSDPRLFKQYQEKLLERAGRAGKQLHYYRTEAAKGGYHGEWCAKQLEKAAVGY